MRRLIKYCRYLLECKKIPSNTKWTKVVIEGKPTNLKLVPSEIVCPFCWDENIPLTNPKLKRRTALLLCIDGIGSVETYTRTCPQCSAIVSYHDHGLGVFNFDNNLVLSFALLDRW